MVVKIQKDVDEMLLLEITNGDKTKMEEVIKKWGLKDIQSFWRFSISLLLSAENNGIWVEINGNPSKVGPVDSLLAGKNDQSEKNY